MSLQVNRTPKINNIVMGKHEFVDFAIDIDRVQDWHTSHILTVKNAAKLTTLR